MARRYVTDVPAIARRPSLPAHRVPVAGAFLAVTRVSRLSRLVASALLLGTVACSNYRRCNPPPAQALETLPARLSQTGLFVDTRLGIVSAAVRAYVPAFSLWSDGTDKRRWFELPAGSRIDSSDMDDWRFPPGSRFYKEFSRGGRRIETRLLVKTGDDERDWAGAAYVWLSDQSDAVLSLDGARDVHGTAHDVPSAAECGGCHGGRRSHVLGFSALQLAAAKEGDALPLSLYDLGREGVLTHVPEHPIALEGSDADRRALGYLHANCGHCHNPERPRQDDGPRCYDPERSIDFWISVEQGRGSRAYETTVPRFVTPGAPDSSRLVRLISRRGKLLHMPPLASKEPDPEGMRLIRDWILRMPARFE